MTEQEWLASSDPGVMLNFFLSVQPLPHVLPDPPVMRLQRPSDRKLRLFACACCRQVWDQLTDNAPCERCKGNGRIEMLEHCPACSGTGHFSRSRRAVEVAERFADGVATSHDMQLAYNSAPVGDVQYGLVRALCVPGNESKGHVTRVAELCQELGSDSTVQAARLRDIFGNVWRKYEFSNIVQLGLENSTMFLPKSLLTSTVVSLAQAIYDDRAFDRMPILADALEDAGATDQSILTHCREKGLHCRGCWVIDLIIGKQ